MNTEVNMDNDTKHQTDQADHNNPGAPNAPTPPPTAPSQSPKPPRKPRSNPKPLRRPVRPPSQCLNRRRSSKIAHLPESLRDQINQMLHDGLTYDEITKKIGS